MLRFLTIKKNVRLVHCLTCLIAIYIAVSVAPLLFNDKACIVKIYQIPNEHEIVVFSNQK